MFSTEVLHSTPLVRCAQVPQWIELRLAVLAFTAAVWQTSICDGDHILCQRRNLTFHQCVASSSMVCRWCTTAHVQNDTPQPRDIIAARLSPAMEVVAV